MHRISAYVPCFNNAATLAAALLSIREQTVPVEEIFVVDDASADNSCEVAASMGVAVFRNNKNLGRGAARARAFNEARQNLVLSCDATIRLEPTFCEKVLPWFECPDVAAVFGRPYQGDPRSVASRWRGRHLLKVDAPMVATRKAGLCTGGVLSRRSRVLAVGNFDSTLRHSEDADLGARLLAAGFDVVFEPAARITVVAENTVAQVLERYWRWNAGKGERVTWGGYLKQVVYSAKVMAMQDIQAYDPLSVALSLFCPHYQFWRSRLGVKRNGKTKAR